MERPIICVTGHRPNKLYGYNLTDSKYVELKNTFKKFLIDKNCREGISGMALGVDTVFALAILELKDEGYDIKLHCAIPCQNQSCNWFNKADIDRYNFILSKADITTLVTDKPYSPYLMTIRNNFMVDKSDIVLSVWDGTSGGTANCVEYATKKMVKRYNINPKKFPFDVLKVS